MSRESCDALEKNLQKDLERKSKDDEHDEARVREPRETYKEIKKLSQSYLGEPYLLDYLSCACILIKLLGHEYTVRFCLEML